MTEDELLEIEARCNAAATGPWSFEFGEHVYGPLGTPNEGGVAYDVCDEPSGEFIAHARTDIPMLIAEVRRLREELVAHETEKAERTLSDARFGRIGQTRLGILETEGK